jgi:DNA (cytosine-5)-methyltransferase 1
LFLVAKKTDLLECPFPLPPKVENKVGWYEAIADLIPSLEKTTLNGWQKQRLCSLGYAETIPFSDDIILFDSCPNMTIERSGARKKNGIPNNQIRFSDQPIFTIKAMRGDVRPSVNQVTLLIDRQPYQADYRCLARWQSIPNSYQFSGNKKLNIEMIGNGVPPLMLQRIIESTLGN